MLDYESEIDEGTSMFPNMFLEISKDGYCGEGHETTRERILRNMFALLWMAADGRPPDDFVEVQKRKISSGRWAEVQSIMKWAGLEIKELHACLVLLAIRGLGNRRVFARECPRSCRSQSERAVIHMIHSKPSFLPSVGVLSEDMRKLFASC